MIIYSAYTCIDGGIVLEDCICIVLCFKPFECIGLSTWAGLYIGGWRCLAEPSDHELWISQLITVYTILCIMLLYSLCNDIRCYTMLHNATRCYTMLHNATQCTTTLLNVTQCCTVLHDVTQCYPTDLWSLTQSLMGHSSSAPVLTLFGSHTGEMFHKWNRREYVW